MPCDTASEKRASISFVCYVQDGRMHQSCNAKKSWVKQLVATTSANMRMETSGALCGWGESTGRGGAVVDNESVGWRGDLNAWERGALRGRRPSLFKKRQEQMQHNANRHPTAIFVVKIRCQDVGGITNETRTIDTPWRNNEQNFILTFN